MSRAAIQILQGCTILAKSLGVQFYSRKSCAVFKGPAKNVQFGLQTFLLKIASIDSPRRWLQFTSNDTVLIQYFTNREQMRRGLLNGNHTVNYESGIRFIKNREKNSLLHRCE